MMIRHTRPPLSVDVDCFLGISCRVGRQLKVGMPQRWANGRQCANCGSYLGFMWLSDYLLTLLLCKIAGIHRCMYRGTIGIGSSVRKSYATRVCISHVVSFPETPPPKWGKGVVYFEPFGPYDVNSVASAPCDYITMYKYPIPYTVRMR